MKIFELFKQDNESLSEESLTTRLKSFDWKYEFSEDLHKWQSGHEQLKLLEQDLYRFWKQSPDKAIQLWNEHSPFGQDDVVPSFILRLQTSEA